QRDRLVQRLVVGLEADLPEVTVHRLGGQCLLRARRLLLNLEMPGLGVGGLAVVRVTTARGGCEADKPEQGKRRGSREKTQRPPRSARRHGRRNLSAGAAPATS